MLLGWFHHSLEDYIHSEADNTRAKAWSDNDWPKIIGHVKSWYLEQVTQSTVITGAPITIAERENIMREYREMYMLPNQSVNEFETKFKCMIKIINDKDRADARKSEEEQAKDFVEKLHGTTFGYWKAEVRADEDRQQQRISCYQQRESIKGYPQTLSEAVNRAKVVERQVADKIKRQQGKGNYAKRGDKSEELGEKRGGKFHELNNFAATNDNPKRKRLKYHEIRSLPPDSKASENGFDECRHCRELGLDSDHIF